MKIKVQEIKEFEVKYLGISAGVRYWEDATVNGVEDENGDLIPLVNSDGDRWEPIIELETGIILNWPKGTTADIHYKVCDDGVYTLLDEKYDLVKKIEDYVPDFLAIDDSGYGDYIIMKVDGEGKINNWKADLSDLSYEAED